MSHAPLAKPAFDLKSTTWVLTALRLRSADVQALAAELDARFADSPGLFDDEALVIDLSALRETDAELDVPALLAQLRRHGMQAIAAQGGTPAQMAAAHAAGLVQASDPEPHAPRLAREPAAPAPALSPAAAGEPAATSASAVGQAPPESAPEVPPKAPPCPAPDDHSAPQAAAAPVTQAAPPAAAPDRMPTLVLDKPLRSGQRAYARGGDLVVLASVSFGAEVIADGSIHVYAPLRGRAMAGARGDVHARIFSTCMEPQLVSIAGIYRTTETPLPASVLGKPAQVRLDGQKIHVEPLDG